MNASHGITCTCFFFQLLSERWFYLNQSVEEVRVPSQPQRKQLGQWSPQTRNTMKPSHNPWKGWEQLLQTWKNVLGPKEYGLFSFAWMYEYWWFTYPEWYGYILQSFHQFQWLPPCHLNLILVENATHFSLLT